MEVHLGLQHRRWDVRGVQRASAEDRLELRLPRLDLMLTNASVWSMKEVCESRSAPCSLQIS